jgi:hypothetical protein
MTIIEAIQAAVAIGKLQEPFTVADVAAIITEYQYGSIQAALSRYCRAGGSQAEPPLTRIEPGRYRLTGGGSKRRR